MGRSWVGLLAASAIMVFASAVAFSSMGIVLFAMARQFGWSEAQAGGVFTTLILTCCIAHLLPVASIPRFGGRWTIVAGSLVLASACALAAMTDGLALFTVSAGLVGVGFSLVANTPSIYLIAGWYGARAPRMIGIYMMLGTLGGAVGPPVAQACVAGAGWRLYWVAMTGLALALGALCALVIREPPAHRPVTPPGGMPGYRRAVRSPQFAVLALAMVAVQTCIVTVSSVIAPHFARHGWSAGFAAQVLGLQGLVGTLATGCSGWLTERCEPRRMLASGLLATACGMLLLAFGGSLGAACTFVGLFGAGWSVSCLAVTVLLVQHFGKQAGTAALATIWMLAGAAAAGPAGAGYVADRTGSFAPMLCGLGLLLLPVTLAALFLRAPLEDPYRPAASRLAAETSVLSGQG